MNTQIIPGGSCPILPIQICLIWVMAEKKTISKLARDVWFAALTVQFWRAKRIPGQSYRPEPKAFRIDDAARLLGTDQTKLLKPLEQLERTGILRLTKDGPLFATSLNDIVVPPPVRDCITTMFDKLHPDTRDKPIAVTQAKGKLD